ncbi:MAG TPA: PspC domain-containing protein [candidate division Zixibacteria bacterium]|nr:PspC domain-containing protein [candidate division Zixibacteria bacterium]
MNTQEKKLPFEKERNKPDKNKTRILFSSRNDLMFAGVLGGLAEFWNMNSTIVRLLFLLTIILTGGLMIIVYFILMKTIPIEPEP